MNRGVPPTAPKARTGEFTPPGTAAPALSNNACERSMFITLRVSQTGYTQVSARISRRRTGSGRAAFSGWLTQVTSRPEGSTDGGATT